MGMSKALTVFAALLVGRVECDQCTHEQLDPNPQLDCGAGQCCYPGTYLSGSSSTSPTCFDSSQDCCASDFGAKACAKGTTCCMSDLSSHNVDCCDSDTQICGPGNVCKDLPCGGSTAPVVDDCVAQNHANCSSCPANGQCGSNWPVACVSTAGYNGCTIKKGDPNSACAFDNKGQCCYVQAPAVYNTIV